MSQLEKKTEAWSALFDEPMSDLVKRYTASVFFDKRLCTPGPYTSQHTLIGAYHRNLFQQTTLL